MRPRTAHGLVFALLVCLAGLASSAAPGPRGPWVFHPSADSVQITFGDSRQWAVLTGLPSPDTTFLSPEHDLVLRSRLDSLFIPRSVGRAPVRFVRLADTLSEVFLFEGRAAHDLVKYRWLLNRYSRFDAGSPTPALDFDDLPERDADARALRARFPLDRIAGRGGDLSRMCNLLHWVHARVRWDGTKENPSAPTLAAGVDSCVRRGRTMNCGGLAETYAAVCRAVGLPARRIVCLPFDPQDPDCHSVVVVWSRPPDRWVYMDPTFEAWWTDASGRALDLQAARALLAAGDTVLLNREANLNGERRDPTEHLCYMSKNLFRFKAWLRSGAEACLDPTGYPRADSAAAPASGATGKTRVVTDNPALFWARGTGRDVRETAREAHAAPASPRK